MTQVHRGKGGFGLDRHALALSRFGINLKPAPDAPDQARFGRKEWMLKRQGGVLRRNPRLLQRKSWSPSENPLNLQRKPFLLEQTDINLGKIDVSFAGSPALYGGSPGTIARRRGAPFWPCASPLCQTDYEYLIKPGPQRRCDGSFYAGLCFQLYRG